MNPHLARLAFESRRILVGVCGGVAAYKLAETVSLLVKAGADVRVAMTPEAARFISPLTFEALSGRPVAGSLFGPQHQKDLDGGEVHIALSEWAEVILAAPATANLMAKLANGLADELVSTTILASTAPLVLAPAMHERMWTAPATAANRQTLVQRGVRFAGPVEGPLASGELGMGRLADQEDILRALREGLPGERDLEGVTIVVSAGGTREAIDPVRFLGNHSSGRMGHALAAAAEARGARVTLVTSSALPVPRGVRSQHVSSAQEMEDGLRTAVRGADVLVMAAAVADFRPRTPSTTKIPKSDMPVALELEKNPDILAALKGEEARPGGALLKVGFAAQTGNTVAYAREKLAAKDLDMIVANDVADGSIGMGSPDNAITIITRDGTEIAIDKAPKEEIAERILDVVVQLRGARPQRQVS